MIWTTLPGNHALNCSKNASILSPRRNDAAEEETESTLPFGDGAIDEVLLMLVAGAIIAGGAEVAATTVRDRRQLSTTFCSTSPSSYSSSY